MSDSRLAVVATGNAFDGITLLGPFLDAEVANEWADREVNRNQEWTVVFIEPVETY